MKVTVVPAQVTTVEDRIMGNFSFSQMLLLVTPIFLSAGLFALLPPFMSGSLYKYILMGSISLMACILSLRLKGKIVAFWLVVILRYNLRPKFYVFNKNTVSFREEHKTNQEESLPTTTTESDVLASHPRLNFHENLEVLSVIDDPNAKLQFETTKKGGLRVRLTEVQDQVQ